MKIALVSLLLLSTASLAFAQKEPLRPAPVPGVDAGTVAPADRAGQSSGYDNGAPFSGQPGNEIAGTGQPSQQTVGTPDGRQSAPAPSTSR